VLKGECSVRARFTVFRGARKPGNEPLGKTPGAKMSVGFRRGQKEVFKGFHRAGYIKTNITKNEEKKSKGGG
jgi:hypothetical protein